MKKHQDEETAEIQKAFRLLIGSVVLASLVIRNRDMVEGESLPMKARELTDKYIEEMGGLPL